MLVVHVLAAADAWKGVGERRERVGGVETKTYVCSTRGAGE